MSVELIYSTGVKVKLQLDAEESEKIVDRAFQYTSTSVGLKVVDIKGRVDFISTKDLIAIVYI